MFIQLVAVICVCYLAEAVPPPIPPPLFNPLRHAPILNLNYDSNPDGSYAYNYATGNGIAAHQRGFVKNLGIPHAEAQVVEGSYTYTGPDGQQYTVNYVADENGYRPQGAHIPKVSSIPVGFQNPLGFNPIHPESHSYGPFGAIGPVGPVGPAGPIGPIGPVHKIPLHK